MLPRIQNAITAYPTRAIAFCVQKSPLSRGEALALGTFAGAASLGLAAGLDKRNFAWILAGGGLAFACIKVTQSLWKIRISEARVIERLCRENTRLARDYTFAQTTFANEKANLERKISQFEKEKALQERKAALAKEAAERQEKENVQIWKTACADTERRTEERELAKAERRQNEVKEREARKKKCDANRALKAQWVAAQEAELAKLADEEHQFERDTLAAKEKEISAQREQKAQRRAVVEENLAKEEIALAAELRLELRQTRKKKVISGARQLVNEQIACLKRIQQLRQSILDSYYTEIGSKQKSVAQSLPVVMNGDEPEELGMDSLEFGLVKKGKRIYSLLNELQGLIPELGGAEVQAELLEAQRKIQAMSVESTQAFSHLTQLLGERLHIHRQTKASLVCQKVYINQVKGAQEKLDELEKTQKEVVALHKTSPATGKQAHMTRLVKIREEMALCQKILAQLPGLQAKSEQTVVALEKKAAVLDAEIEKAEGAYLSFSPHL